MGRDRDEAQCVFDRGKDILANSSLGMFWGAL